MRLGSYESLADVGHRLSAGLAWGSIHSLVHMGHCSRTQQGWEGRQQLISSGPCSLSGPAQINACPARVHNLPVVGTKQLKPCQAIRMVSWPCWSPWQSSYRHHRAKFPPEPPPTLLLPLPPTAGSTSVRLSACPTPLFFCLALCAPLLCSAAV